jgi:putative ABC transport system permease protein
VPSFTASLVPTLRARVASVQGARVQLEGLDEVRGQGSLAREYVITYRNRLEANESLIAGTFATSATAQPEVSIEESIHERFRIDVGDLVRFDVLGRTIEARVSSIRRVEWSDARTGGFMFVFAPGALERAPQTFIAIARGPAAAADRARLQRDIVAAFPNVSAIDVRDVAQRVEAVARNITLAISIVGGVAVFSGLLILVGSIAMTKFQRLHESAVFKTLGATTGTVAATLAAEYATLGALAGAVGAVASIGLSWFVCRRILDVPWSPLPALVAAGIVTAVVLVGLLGVVSSLDVLRRKPLAVLRTQ